jgi:hypothetical protein
MATMKNDTDEVSDAEAERIASRAIRRSFEMPYKPQRDLVGKVGRPAGGKRKPLQTTKKAK